MQLFLKILPFEILNFLSWDVYGYYSYLPFNLIYHDIGMQNQDLIKEIFEKYNPSSTYYQAFLLSNGNWISVYPIGMSLFYLPFFLIAHIWSYFSSFPQDGFSFPYQICISLGMLVYFSIGLFYLRKLLLRFFNENITMLTMLIIILGTNIFHEAFNDGLEPHNILFGAYCLLMYLLDMWYKAPSIKQSIGLGVLLGIILLVRGSEVVAGILVVFWGMNRLSDIPERYKYILKNFKYYFVTLIITVIVFSPQLVYWKIVTDQWFFNSYKMAEGFNLLKPNLLDFFFSFKKGVFIYTPVVLVAFFALFNNYFRNSRTYLAVILFLFLNTYLISSWLVWWGATSFGSRYFAQSISLLVLPMGFFIQRLSEHKLVVKSFFIMVFSIFIFLNVFQTWQFINGIINGERMTYAYYKAVFLKTAIPADALYLLEPDLDSPSSMDFPGKDMFNSRTISYLDFDTLNTLFVNPLQLDSTLYYSGKYCLRMDSNFIYSPTLRISMNELSNKDFVWVGVSFDYFPRYDLKENPASLVVHMTIDGNCRDFTKYRALDLEALPYKVGEWNKAEFFYLTPRVFTREDNLVVYLYNRSSKSIYFDNFHIVSYENK